MVDQVLTNPRVSRVLMISSRREMQVQACKRMVVKVDPRLWQRGAGRDHIVDIIPSQVGVNWHSAAKGAALVATYHATLCAVRTEACLVPGPLGPDILHDQVASLAARTVTFSCPSRCGLQHGSARDVIAGALWWLHVWPPELGVNCKRTESSNIFLFR